MFKFRLDLLSTCIAVCSSLEQLWVFFSDMGLDWRDGYKLASTHNLPRNMRSAWEACRCRGRSLWVEVNDANLSTRRVLRTNWRAHLNSLKIWGGRGRRVSRSRGRSLWVNKSYEPLHKTRRSYERASVLADAAPHERQPSCRQMVPGSRGSHVAFVLAKVRTWGRSKRRVPWQYQGQSCILLMSRMVSNERAS